MPRKRTSEPLVWRILIVDDNPADVESIQTNLVKTRSDNGPAYKFRTAGMLAEAIEILACEAFDLVLLDLQLPDTVDLDGLTAIREGYPSTPIIILTGNDPDCATKDRAANKGAQEFLNKDELCSRSLARIVGFALDRWHLTELRLQKQAFEDAQKVSKLAQEKAEGASKFKTEFLALMSHEIRTPLNAVLGFAEILADGKEAAASKQLAIEAIRRNGLALSRLLDDILDLSKVEAGRLVVERLDFSVHDFLADLNETMRPLAELKNLRFEFLLGHGVPERLISDPARLRQILINIIGNAIKFTRAGLIKVEVLYLKTSPEDTVPHLVFHISDTGQGIAMEQRRKLFTAFTQADTSTTRQFGGTGLGLELSRRLARALGGDVTITASILGEGTTFMVSIAPDIADLKVSVVPIKKPNRRDIASISSLAANPLRLDGQRILVVDDVPDNLTLISLFLTRAGATVSLAADGYQGVEKALKESPDLIFMDMLMPGMDGYEATTQLRRQGFLSPIVALTANAMPEEHKHSRDVGCNDCMTKPVNPEALIHLAEMLISAQSGLENS